MYTVSDKKCWVFLKITKTIFSVISSVLWVSFLMKLRNCHAVLTSFVLNMPSFINSVSKACRCDVVYYSQSRTATTHGVPSDISLHPMHSERNVLKGHI